MTVTSPRPAARTANSLLVRLRLAVAAAIGAVSGIAPHVLHHVGPIAGAAVVSGVTGTVVFGALGFLLMIPSLLRIKRHFGTWFAPAVALVVFATLFTVSTVWLGPIIRGEASAPPDAHSIEHDSHLTPTTTPAR